MPSISPTIIWACLGVALIIFEVFTTTFFILFFGIAALLVAVIRLFGLDHTATEIILFAMTGIAGTLIFRKKIIKSFKSTSEIELPGDKLITITQDIDARSTGTIQYRGSTWRAINDSEYALKKGDVAVIERIDGVKLVLKQR